MHLATNQGRGTNTPLAAMHEGASLSLLLTPQIESSGRATLILHVPTVRTPPSVALRQCG